MSRRPSSSEPIAPRPPGAFLPDGHWNPDGQLHHRGELDRLVRALVRERRFARLTPREASLAIQAASGAVLAFPNWRQWETCQHWALCWTSTSAEEAVKRAGETVAGPRHWCGDEWATVAEKDCDDPRHRRADDPEALRLIMQTTDRMMGENREER